MEDSYSNWQRIDLHIHSDYSKKTKHNDYKGNFSVETLYSKLVAQEVDIFSLTDHNIINLPAYKKYYENYNHKNDPLLLIGVELDISGSTKTYHSLLIFSGSNYSSAEQINSLLENRYTEKGQDDFERKLTFDDIISLFGEKDFFFIPHAGNTSSINEAYKTDIKAAQKMLILMQSPLEKVKEKSKQLYNESFDKVLYSAFQHKNDFAYIEFSDNHYVEQYPCGHMGDHGLHDFYYVKGSKNYETLRLAFIDPQSRIKSSSQYVELNTTRNYITSLEIATDSVISETKLRFSPHLNVIIGGRSSGKSLLLDILNRSIDTLHFNPKYDELLRNTTYYISSKYDAQLKTSTHISTEIIQINQGDIVSYFENSQLSDLANKSGKAEQYLASKQNFIELKNRLSTLMDTLYSVYSYLFTLNPDKTIVLHDYTIQQLLYDNYLLKIDINLVKSNFFATEQFDTTINSLNSLVTEIEKLKKSVTITFLENENTIIDNFLLLVTQKRTEQQNMKSLHDHINKFICTTKQNIEDANMLLTQAGQDRARAIKINTEIQNSIKVHFKGLFDLHSKIDAIKNFNYNHTESIVLDEDSSLNIELDSQNSLDELITDGIKDSGGNSIYESIMLLLYKKLKLKNYPDNAPENFKKKMVSQLANLFKLFDSPSDYLKYADETTSKNNSPGYNSEKYLKVLLNNPSCGLILIDQPEDNLGNKFISEQLVDLIREIKFKKQIFLVTHNPAIVVYGDAESIIIAENDNNSISYKQVKLEDVESQKEICRILDGGEYIFDNRSKKYNIKKLLSQEV